MYCAGMVTKRRPVYLPVLSNSNGVSDRICNVYGVLYISVVIIIMCHIYTIWPAKTQSLTNVTYGIRSYCCAVQS